MQRIHSCAAAALLAVTLTARAQFQDVFFIGTDNSQGIEFELQTASLVDYYWENGNYSGVGLGGLNWVSGMEPWDNAVANDNVGFPRALTQAGVNPQTNIFFNLDANESTAGQPIRVTIDLVSPMVNTTHDIDLRVNNNAPFATRTAINSSQLWVVDTTAGAMGAVTGPNVLRVRRTGGTLSGGVASIQFDHLRLQADIAPQYINTFTTNDTVLRPGEVATLTWVLYQPGATVSIDQGIGDVTGLTVGGTGSINVSPAVATTYTLSATFNGLTQNRQSPVINVSPWSALFEAGTDNGAYADFSHDLAADDDYYFAGNYTSVGGPNQVANEVMNDDTNTETVAGRTGNPAIGFERTLRESDPHQNIWYVAPPALNDPSARLRVSCDIWRIGSTGTTGNGTHQLEFSCNGTVVRTENNITTPRLVQFETTAVTAGYAPGPNKLTVRRIGGTLAGFLDVDYINLEYMVGTPPAITGVTDDGVLGTHTVSWTATTGRTYRVQKSTDGGTSWIDLGVGFPKGGAKGTALFYEDRDTPWANPRPSYRILLE